MSIGIFDSGVGGLSILREIRRELPDQTLLYVADSAHAPYGDKSSDFVVARARAITNFLLEQGATSLVVACNTATAVAVDSLRSIHAVPIVGIEPAVKPAVAMTRSGVIGVLTTSRTAVSARFQDLLTRFDGAAQIVVQPCPGWVELVERGDLASELAERAVAQHVRPLLEQGADVLVLGCTHYSFLASAIRKVAGESVALVDPAPAVARHVHQRLRQAGMLLGSVDSKERYWTSARPEQTAALAAELLGRPIEVSALPVNVSSAAV